MLSSHYSANVIICILRWNAYLPQIDPNRIFLVDLETTESSTVSSLRHKPARGVTCGNEGGWEIKTHRSNPSMPWALTRLNITFDCLITITLSQKWFPKTPPNGIHSKPCCSRCVVFVFSGLVFRSHIVGSIYQSLFWIHPCLHQRLFLFKKCCDFLCRILGCPPSQ